MCLGMRGGSGGAGGGGQEVVALMCLDAFSFEDMEDPLETLADLSVSTFGLLSIGK